MKNPTIVFQRFQNSAQSWLNAIDSYTPEQFAYQPAPDAWSIGQTYQHLLQATRRMHLHQLDLCIQGKGSPMNGGKTMRGRVAFLIGSFPPIRIKVPPSKEYTPAQPVDMAAVKRSLVDLVEEMRAASTRLASAGKGGTRTRHPGFGMLGAEEWYQLVEMHFRHHLRQKRRIDAALNMARL